MAEFDNDNVNLDDGTPPEESSNRTFLMAAGVLGGLVLLALLCLGGYVLLQFNSSQTVNQTAQVVATQQQATIHAGSTQFVLSQAETQAAAATNTVPPTNTPVIAQPTATFTSTPNPATATVGAAFTQIAVSTQTIVPTSTALPSTGFADDLGIPSLALAALALVVVIFLVRRMRSVPTR